jgi:hypothetical protein
MAERRFLVRIVARTDGQNALGIARGASEAVSIYFADTNLATAFVARWCVGSRIEVIGFKCATISRRRGSVRGCIGYRDGGQDQLGGQRVQSVAGAVACRLKSASTFTTRGTKDCP